MAALKPNFSQSYIKINKTNDRIFKTNAVRK